MERVENPELVNTAYQVLYKSYHDESRRERIHLTDLIYCLTKSFFDKVVPLPPTEEEILLFALGLGLQKVLVPADKEAEAIHVDGISCSPDFISEQGLKAELKTTRQSSLQTDKVSKIKTPKDFPDTWVDQIMGYCYAAQQVEYDLLILHMMGNYAPPFPQMVGWKLKFKKEELVGFWSHMLERKTILEFHLSQPEDEQVIPEPFNYNKEWECKYCRYKLQCDVLGG